MEEELVTLAKQYGSRPIPEKKDIKVEIYNGFRGFANAEKLEQFEKALANTLNDLELLEYLKMIVSLLISSAAGKTKAQDVFREMFRPYDKFMLEQVFITFTSGKAKMQIWLNPPPELRVLHNSSKNYGNRNILMEVTCTMSHAVMNLEEIIRRNEMMQPVRINPTLGHDLSIFAPSSADVTFLKQTDEGETHAIKTKNGNYDVYVPYQICYYDWGRDKES